MPDTSRHLFIDLILIFLSLLFAVLITWALFGNEFPGNEVTLLLHDTYFVFSKWLVVLAVFSFVTFFLFFTKSLIRNSRTTFSRVVTVVAGLAFIITLAFFIKMLLEFSPGDPTLYPPLSGLGPDKLEDVAERSTGSVIVGFLFGMEVIAFAMLAFHLYRWKVK